MQYLLISGNQSQFLFPIIIILKKMVVSQCIEVLQFVDEDTPKYCWAGNSEFEPRHSEGLANQHSVHSFSDLP